MSYIHLAGRRAHGRLAMRARLEFAIDRPASRCAVRAGELWQGAPRRSACPRAFEAVAAGAPVPGTAGGRAVDCPPAPAARHQLSVTAPTFFAARRAGTPPRRTRLPRHPRLPWLPSHDGCRRAACLPGGFRRAQPRVSFGSACSSCGGSRARTLVSMARVGSNSCCCSRCVTVWQRACALEGARRQ